LAEKGVAGSRQYTASVVAQRAGSTPGDLISVYTGAIARFLVGNLPFNAGTSFKSAGKSERLQRRAGLACPASFYAQHWGCKLGP
jgi:hypothetical protein